MILKLLNEKIYKFKKENDYHFGIVFRSLSKKIIAEKFKIALDKLGNTFYYTTYIKTLMFWKYLRKENLM